MQIWEREASLDLRELQIEAERRDGGTEKTGGRLGSVSSYSKGEASRSDLQVIWGAGWEPAHVVEFSKPLHSSAARAELLRFFAERHDGHLVAAATCWDGMNAASSFDGASFHEFSKKYVEALGETLRARLLASSLSSVHSV